MLTLQKDLAKQPEMWKSEKVVSSSSVVELKAQLAEVKRKKTHGSTDQGSNKTVKKMAQNRGVAARDARDRAQLKDESVDGKLAESWISLQRKAAIYDQMQAEDYDDSELLVDFVRKSTAGVPSLRQEDKDPWIEYSDEFGRLKIVRKSQLPVEATHSKATAPGLRGQAFVKSGTSYELSQDTEKQDIREMHSRDWDREEERLRWEEQVNLETLHYDAKKEVRPLGTGFYRLSQDEEERLKQLEDLDSIRSETLLARTSVPTKDPRTMRLEEQRQRVLQAKKRKRDESISTAAEDAKVKSAEFLSRLKGEMS